MGLTKLVVLVKKMKRKAKLEASRPVQPHERVTSVEEGT